MSMMDSGASGASAIANTLLSASISIAQDLVKLSVRVAAQTANGSLHAAGAMLTTAHKELQTRGERGQVGLNKFTQLAENRELVNVADADVSRALKAELNKHGVTYAVEKQQDGTVTYHVQGKDVSLVAHALEQAQQRVDALNISRGEQSTVDVAPPFHPAEWDGDGPDADAPEPDTRAMPPVPELKPQEAAQQRELKSHQAQPVESPATAHERGDSVKLKNGEKPSLGEVVGGVVKERTEVAKKDHAARVAQRDTGLSHGQVTPPAPNGSSR